MRGETKLYILLLIGKRANESYKQKVDLIMNIDERSFREVYNFIWSSVSR